MAVAVKTKARSAPFDRIESEVIAGYESEGTGDRTMYRVRSTLRLMRDGARVRTAADLGEPMIGWFRLHHPHKLQTLQSIWNRAARMGLADPPPIFAESHGPRRVAPARTAAPTPEEVGRFAAHAAGLIEDWLYHRDFALAATIRFTGMIVQDAIRRLMVEDIDLKAGIIRSRRHERLEWTRIPPEIRIPPELGAILAAWLPRTGCEWAFPGVTGRCPWAASGNKTHHARIRALSDAAGIRGHPMSYERLRRYHSERLGMPVEAGWLKSAASPATPRPAVELGADRESAWFRGKREELSDSEFRAVELLVLRYPRTYTLKEMNGAYGGTAAKNTGWRELLRRLKTRGDHVDSSVLFPTDWRRLGRRGGFGIAPH